METYGWQEHLYFIYILKKQEGQNEEIVLVGRAFSQKDVSRGQSVMVIQKITTQPSELSGPVAIIGWCCSFVPLQHQMHHTSSPKKSYQSNLYWPCLVQIQAFAAIYPLLLFQGKKIILCYASRRVSQKIPFIERDKYWIGLTNICGVSGVEIANRVSFKRRQVRV